MSNAIANAPAHSSEVATVETVTMFPAIAGHPPENIRYDLTSSDSETLSVSDLLALAGRDGLERWDALSLGYTDPRGRAELRDAIARRHATLGPENIVVCAGAQEALFCVIRALVTPDDHGVVVLPIYPPAEHALTTACAATGVPLVREKEWRLDLDQVAAALRPSTKVVIANFPNSPTGATLDQSELEGLVALCRQRGLWLVNDEVYRQTDVPRAGYLPMLADIYERGISINGLSKGFGLPGLRIGWVACADAWILSRVLTAKTRLSTCVAATSEVLGTIALQAEATVLGLTREIGRHNSAWLSAMLHAMPDLFDADNAPNLAFAYPRYRGLDGSDQLAKRLARHVGLHLLPASSWRSPLASLPMDYVRIGLGHRKSASALCALADYLSKGR